MKIRKVVLLVAVIVMLSTGLTPALGQTAEPTACGGQAAACPAGEEGSASLQAVDELADASASEKLPEGIFVVRVYYNSVEDSQLLTDFDLFEYNNQEERYFLVAAGRADLARLRSLGFRAELDPQETANFARLATPLAEQQAEIGIESIPGYTCYRTVEETYAAAQALVAAHPDLASWSDAGNSWEKSVGQADGYDMMVLKLTNSAIGGAKPKLFITASIHAREYAPAELATRFGEYLVNRYGTDADVTWILDHHEVHLMLQANPDGRKEAEAGRSWRKNTNETYCGVTSTSRGADLNRNFSYQWGTGGSSSIPCDATYRGSSGGSEPETQAVQNYLKQIFPDQRGTGAAPSDATGIYLDLHSYGGYVIWPWGYSTTDMPSPNNSQHQTLGRKFAYFNSYSPFQIADGLYVASGGSLDYAYGELGVASLCFELGTAFFQACSTFEGTIYPTNLQALIYAAKVSRTPYQTSLGPDALNVAVSPASVASGVTATLTTTINDTRYRSGTGEPTQAIAAAEYYVDTPPWLGGTAYAMAASDGSFSATTENAIATVNTAGLTAGRHTLFVRGKDANNNWGAFSAAFLEVTGQANQPPTAIPQAVVAGEDTPISIILSGSDPENTPLTFSVQAGPSRGTLSGIAPNLTYTPAANHNGADSFTFVANDGASNSTPATVSITVTPVNDAPVASPQTVTTEQDKALFITLAGSDVDGNTPSYRAITAPTYGTLSGTAPDLTYTPATGYLGADSFTFVANDGTIDSDPATVSIIVTAVNHPPIADEQTVTLDEDVPAAITLTGSDPDGGPITFGIVTAPGHGTLSGTAPALTYTPAANYHGPDSFSFVVSDGLLTSAEAAVSITVNPVNDAPVATGQSVTTPQDTPVAVTLAGSDVDGSVLSYTVTNGPAHGALSGAAPTMTYTPASGYSGADSFTFVANDGQVDSAPATVSITVNPAITGPVLYLGSSTSGTAGGIAFEDEDILVKDMVTGAWSLFFDGSDIGLTNTDIDAFELQTDDSLLMSFDTAFTLSGFGAVDDSDILRFVPSSVGATTAGAWSMYFDGSDVGLSTSDEDIDAFAVLPDGRLLVSTLGNVSVTGASGADEDLLVFTASRLGATTTGTWAMYFDGSDVGLSSTSNEDVNGVWVDASGKIYLTTLGAFGVTGVSGDGSDVFACTPSSLGSTTRCTFSMYWAGSANGFSGEVTDSLSIVQ